MNAGCRQGLVALLCLAVALGGDAGAASRTAGGVPSRTPAGGPFGDAVAEIQWLRVKGVLEDATVSGRDRVRCIGEYLAWYTGDNLRRERAQEIKGSLQEAFPQSGHAAGVVWLYSKPAGVWFSRTETTVGQFWECSHYGDCSTLHVSTTDTDCSWDQMGRHMDYPVNCVEWFGASDFCKWVGGRLPTEAEWYAEASDSGRRDYSWGNEEPHCDRTVWRRDLRNPAGCGRDSPWPVCSKPAGFSVSGLCDLSGNVSEWTSGWYEVDKYRAYLGGNWMRYLPSDMEVDTRAWWPPDGRSGQLGFRCVREPACFGAGGSFVGD